MAEADGNTATRHGHGDLTQGSRDPIVTGDRNAAASTARGMGMTIQRTSVALRLSALALCGALLAGCSAPSFSPPAESGARPASPDFAVPSTGGSGDAAGSGTAPEAAPTRSTDRQVARTASASIEVADLLTGADAARDLAESLGGWVTDEQVRLADDHAPRSARITLSVPSNRLDEAIGKLPEIGTVTSRTTTAEDVTDAVVDTDARIRNLEASVARVQALMERAGTITEVAQVERELSQRQTELESLKARQQSLQGQVERAPLTLSLNKAGASAVSEDNPLLKGLARGWEAFLGSVGILFVLMGALGPFAVLAALVVVPLVLRQRRRRRLGQMPVRPAPVAGVHAVPPAEQRPATGPRADDAQAEVVRAEEDQPKDPKPDDPKPHGAA